MRWRWIVLGWFAAAAGIGLGWYDVYGKLWVFAAVVRWTIAAVGVVLFALIAARALRDPRAWDRLVASIALAAAGVVVWRQAPAWGARVRFELARGGYERTVAALERGAPPPEGVFVDRGPPLRVAFRWPGGVLDNWCGVIRDASGTPERGDFGDQVVTCERLDDAWYLCCFT